MKKLIASFFALLAIVGGFTIGIGGFTWGIYLLILLCKSAVAVKFTQVLVALAYVFLSGLVGWIWGMFWFFVAAWFAVADSSKYSRFTKPPGW